MTWEAARVRSVTYEGGADYWEHSAVLRALMQKPWHPDNPFLANHVPSSRFGPQFVLIALVARGLHLDALGAMTLAASANTLLFLCAVRVFFASYFRDRLAPLYGLLVMFFGWWQGFHFSNVYALNVLFANASYPSTTALGLTLLGFSFALRLLRGEFEQPNLMLGGIVIWAAVVFIVHPLTAMLALSGVGLLALSEPKAPLHARLELISALLLGLALSRFWPYFSPWQVVRTGENASAGWGGLSALRLSGLHLRPDPHPFYEPQGLLSALGLSLIALLALPYFLAERKRWFIGFGAVAMLVPFGVNAFVPLPLGHRFLLLAIVYLQIGVVWLLLKFTSSDEDAWPFLARRGARVACRLAALASLLVFVSHGILLAYTQLDNPKFYLRSESPVVRNMKAIAAAAGPGAVVLASPLLSWPLPTFGPKVLTLFHDDPLVFDLAQRESDVTRFLSVASDEERRQILDRYGVTHVLLGRESNGALLGFLRQHGSARPVGTGYHLYTLGSSARRP
ncbi:MAG TPA: hypothetical protein VHV51_00440 [Polyangiaceae bacterium]|nr:hypothetical protein [Polyangiaceae bacterium]